MVRIARVVMPGWPHHVTQRGNHRQTVFFNDRDREVYLELLAKYKGIYHIGLIGHSLMSNHVHKIPIPEFDTSLAKAIGRTHKDYSPWQNVQCNQTGHLWQARFYSCPIELSIGLLIMRHKGKVGLGGWEIGRFRARIGTGSELPET